MAANQAVKKNLSSMQVLKTLQVLLEGNYTMTELIDILNKREDEPIFNNSVVSKYINTCRYLGIEIPKIHNRYFVASLPFGLNLSAKDLDLLEHLQKVGKDCLTLKHLTFFNGLIDKISKFSNKCIMRVEKRTAKLINEIFERAVEERRKVCLMFRAKATLECIPVGMEENNGKAFFRVSVNEKERLIAVERVSGIEVLDLKYGENFLESSVIFSLKGELAKRYTLRDNEKLLSSSTETRAVISNTGEDHQLLYSRLLRYDSCCEILHPASCREEMREILNDALSNYKV